MFTTSKKIYEDIGEFIEGFTEEYINSMIYNNSMELISVLDELAKQEAVANVTYSQDDDGIYTVSNRMGNNWVRYKTDIDLVLARYFGISYRYGTQSKDDYIRGGFAVTTVVKARNTTYDNWARTTTWKG